MGYNLGSSYLLNFVGPLDSRTFLIYTALSGL